MKTLLPATRVIALLFICTFTKGQPYPYKGSEFIRITFQTTQEVIKRLVPEPLVANSEGIMILDIGLQKMLIGLQYHEMILSIPVAFNGKMGAYAALLYLNSMRAITPGREVWGFPKFEAEISLQKDDNKAVALIQKDGKVIIAAELELGNIIHVEKTPDPLVFVLKFIPGVEKGSVDVKKLNSVYMTDNTITKYQEARAKLTINSIPDNAAGEIPVIKILNASYSESNFILGFGQTEYDYLKQK